MSIERELLKEVLEYFDPLGLNTEHCGDLPERIKELLAQPEQEPKFNFDLERMKAAIESPISDVTVDDLVKQVKQEPVGIVRTIGGYPDDSEHVVDWLCKYKDLKEGDKLYLAPPRREPLSEDTILRLISEHRYFPPNLVRAIEKAHGIGGEI